MWFRLRDKGKQESEQALRNAKINLNRIQERGKDVSSVSDALRDIRNKDHFSEHLERIILGRSD